MMVMSMQLWKIVEMSARGSVGGSKAGQRTVPDGGAWKKQALLEPTLNDIRAFLDRTLAHFPAEALDLGAHGELALERSGSCEQPADAGPAPSGDAAAESGGWVGGSV
jgi:hypothetical protein